jgi:hypothetical protein
LASACSFSDLDALSEDAHADLVAYVDGAANARVAPFEEVGLEMPNWWR